MYDVTESAAHRVDLQTAGIYTGTGAAAAATVSGQTHVRPTGETGPRRDGNDVIHDNLHGYGRRNDVMVNPASWSGAARGIH